MYTHQASEGYNAEKVVRVRKEVLEHVLFGPAKQDELYK